MHSKTFMGGLIVAASIVSEPTPHFAPAPCTAPASACEYPVQQDDFIRQRSRGSASAPIVVYEMSDFQCPWCRKHAMETFPELEERFIDTGKVRWVFVNFPIVSIHPNSVAAAEFAMCAAQQDRFWPIHDLIFKHQEKWAGLDDPTPFLITLADSIDLPRDSLRACLESGAGRAIVKRDAEGAARAGATSTPTFYIEGGLLAGYAPVEVFAGILDSIYNAPTTE